MDLANEASLSFHFQSSLSLLMLFLRSDTIGALFRVTVALNEEVASPINLVNDLSLMHVRVNDVYVCAVTNQNAVRPPFSLLSYFIIFIFYEFLSLAKV